MATVSFNKLNLKKKNEIKTIVINEQEIEIKQYLPIQEKFNVIANTLTNAQDENGFFNGVKLELHCTLQIIYAYTNLKFTEKQLEHADELFDLMESNGIIDQIFAAIPEEETQMIMDATEKLASNIVTYKNSALGILEGIQNSYDLSKINLQEINNMIKDPDQIKFVKNLINSVS